jgi:mRNA-degrading endonuclease toxin of MazEF toxin-antitoxin module
LNHPKLAGVYIASFPFIETDERKLRPVVVVSLPYGEFNIVCVVPISSKAVKSDVDLTVTAWQDAGLSRPSVARVHRLTTMLQSDLVAELGRLDPEDSGRLKQKLREFLDL